MRFVIPVHQPDVLHKGDESRVLLLDVLMDRELVTGRATARDYQRAVRKALDGKFSGKAQRLSRLYKTAFPEDEQAWVLALECAFDIRDGTGMAALLEEMKHSRIRYGKETLGLVRFWQRRGI